MSERSTGHSERFARKEMVRAERETGKEGWRKRYRTSNQRKSMWPVLVVFLGHGNDKLIG